MVVKDFAIYPDGLLRQFSENVYHDGVYIGKCNCLSFSPFLFEYLTETHTSMSQIGGVYAFISSENTFAQFSI